jgi:hypothetical protein
MDPPDARAREELRRFGSRLPTSGVNISAEEPHLHQR